MRRAMLKYTLVVCLLGVFVAIPILADATLPLSTQLASAAYDDKLYAVTINGQTVSDGTEFLLEADDVILVKVAELRSWGLLATSNTKLRGTDYTDVRALAGVSATIDEQRQIISLTAAPSSFVTVQIDLANFRERYVAMPASGRGASVDYDLHASTGSGGAHYNGLITTGYFSGSSLITSDFEVGSTGHRGVSRLQTLFRREDSSSHTSLRIGDTVSSPGSVGDVARFIGVQYGTDFSADPRFWAYSAPELTGIATSPSLLQLYVNNVEAYSGPIGTGPFIVQHIPVVSGAGDIKVYVKDALGRISSVSLPYYYSPQSLGKGVVDFAVEGGFTRRTTVGNSPVYGAGFVEMRFRKGYTDHFTGEVRGALSGLSDMLGVDFELTSASLGSLDLGILGSRSPAGRGALVQGIYRYQSGAFDVGLRALRSVGTYVDLADFATTPYQHAEFNGTVGLTLRGGGNLQVALGRARQSDGSTIGTSTATLSFNSRMASVYASTYAAGGQRGVRVGFSKPIGNVGTEAATGTATNNAAPSATVEFSLTSPDRRSALDVTNYVGAGGFSANAHSRLATHSLTLHAQQNSGYGRYDASVGGSVLFTGGLPKLAAPTQESYALVRVPGFRNVRVYANGTLAGRTDNRGDLIVTDIVPGYANQISIDARDLPITATFDRDRAVVSPFPHTGVTVTFNAAQKGAVRFRVIGEDGGALASGSMLARVGNGDQWVIGNDGGAYVDDLLPGNVTLTGEHRGMACHIQLDVPRDVFTEPYLGTLRCTR